MKLDELTTQLMEEAFRQEGRRDYKEAIKVYTNLIRIDPDKYVYYFNRGVMHGYLDHVDAAICDYTKALELNPAHMTSRMNRGVAYKDKGDVEKAIAETEKCIEMYPDSIARVNLRGMYHDRDAKKKRLEEQERSPLSWLFKKLRLKS